MQLTILSFNCYGLPFFISKTRRSALLEELAHLNPDVVCLQEVIFASHAAELRRSLEARGYHIFTTPGRYTTYGGLLLASRHAFVSTEFALYKNQGKFFSSQFFDCVLGKGYQKAVIEKEGREVTILNTHLVASYKQQVEERGPVGQLRELIKVVTNASRPIVLCGDLNFPPDHKLYGELIRNTCTYDEFSRTACMYDPLTYSKRNTVLVSNPLQGRYYKARLDSRIDYTLVSDDIITRDQTVVFADERIFKNKKYYLSDHFGLYTRIEIPN